MITENLSTLKIHKLTQAQYDRALEVGNIDPNAIYLTPEKEPIFIQNDEPVDAEDGTLWLDLDAVGQSSGGGEGAGIPSGGTVGQVLTIGVDGNPVWADPTGGANIPAAEEVLF